MKDYTRVSDDVDDVADAFEEGIETVEAQEVITRNEEDLLYSGLASAGLWHIFGEF